MGIVVLLTGSPATGKSTLRKALTKMFTNVVEIDYGQELIAAKERQHGTSLTYRELRQMSADVIHSGDVATLDEQIIARISELRPSASIIIDSHAVTRETYGFRAIPFSISQVQRLAFDCVILLRCNPVTTLMRLKNDADGRQNVTEELAREHQTLQEAVALNYAITSGSPIFILDTSDGSQDVIVQQASKILVGLGMELR